MPCEVARHSDCYLDFFFYYFGVIDIEIATISLIVVVVVSRIIFADDHTFFPFHNTVRSLAD